MFSNIHHWHTWQEIKFRQGLAQPEGRGTIIGCSGADLCWALGGRVICNFTPILSYFQYWGEWTSTTILFRFGNFVKTKKKCKWITFFPKFRWRPKKRSLSKIEHFFPQFSLRCTPIQIIGGDEAKLLGGYIPPPCFGTPDRMPP